MGQVRPGGQVDARSEERRIQDRNAPDADQTDVLANGEEMALVHRNRHVEAAMAVEISERRPARVALRFEINSRCKGVACDDGALRASQEESERGDEDCDCGVVKDGPGEFHTRLRLFSFWHLQN